MKGSYTLTLRQPVSPVPNKENPFCLVRGFLQLMESQDPLIVGHCERTAQFALALGHAIELADQELLQLHYAALLHDLGKFSLPPRVRTGTNLSPDEEMKHQCHPRVGAAILQQWPSLNTASVLIAHHHERWDGYGYPYGLRGTLIPLGSRILSIADAFDKLTSPCPHGEGQPFEKAVQVLTGGSGLRFDPELTEQFLLLIPNLFNVRNEIQFSFSHYSPVGNLVS